MRNPPAVENVVPLVARAVEGDPDAFGALVARFQNMAVGYAHGLLGDRHAAEDAAQEAFIAAWQLLPQLRDPAAFPGWLRRIIVKHCDRLTRKRLPPDFSWDALRDEAEPGPNPATLAEAGEFRAQVLTALQKLPAAEREVVLLFYYGDHSYAEICHFLNLPLSTVKSRLNTGRKKLKQRMLPMLDETTKHLRPSRDGAFARRVMSMIRPSDRELAGGGSLGCAGADIWAMMCAAVSGDNENARALLEREPLLASAEYWYTQPIHYAVREGHLETVSLLLTAGADPTHVRYGGEDLQTVALDRGHTLVAEAIARAQKERLGSAMQDHEIHTAVTQGETARVAELLALQPDLVNLVDARGRQPLHLACQAADVPMIELLLDQGADTEACTGSNDTYLPAAFTPLDFLVWGNDWWIWPKMALPAISLLLARGAKYTVAIAAALGDLERVEAILARDPAQVNAPRPCGRRALSAAAQFGHVEILRRLLEAGADPNLPEGRYVKRGCALFFAAKTHRADMVDLLLARGADPDQGIDSCGLVYHVADEMTRIKLFQHGLRRTDVDVENVEALAIWAAKDPEELARLGCGTIFTMVTKNEWFEEKQQSFPDEKKEAVLRMLLAMGVKVPPVVTGCRGYLWHKPRLARILMENGMDPDLPNWQLQTPLHSLCALDAKGNPDENRVELAELFLEFGANLNARDEEYRSTPLGWAARNGLQDMVELLLRHGAAIQLPDDEPWATPLAWAQRRGHGAIADLLQI